MEEQLRSDPWVLEHKLSVEALMAAINQHRQAERYRSDEVPGDAACEKLIYRLGLISLYHAFYMGVGDEGSWNIATERMAGASGNIFSRSSGRDSMRAILEEMVRMDCATPLSAAVLMGERYVKIGANSLRITRRATNRWAFAKNRPQ